eukprot:CAMPEP_0181425416 /NCGR_PEP_ID=MMETSP1110-20121109/15146_1 /TAXON_ID=174948 /ORGANISM="Symbiodinium sp., Strain CCMP421" /LENGTH=758 /DNA_ID=CAMNT_0023548599 /DNA_START=55 /DNA_END=2331 /DNA_ORIENTATION=-
MALRGVLLCACICAASSSAGDFDCGDEPYLMLEEVLHNNLGGQGPHRGKEGIVYQAVEYYKNMHRIVHVNVHAVNKYVPWDVFANGLNGRFGVFTQEAGHSVDVEFSFTTSDGKPVTLRTFTISIYDMDRDEKKGEGVERVIPLQPYNMVYLTNTTQVKKVKTSHGDAFEGTELGTYQDNPVKVVHEHQIDEDKSIAFEFKDVTKVRMTFASTAGAMARTTQWACLNALMCKAKKDNPGQWHTDLAEQVALDPQKSGQVPIRTRTGVPFEYKFPSGLFSKSTGHFRATSGGATLPAWLHFNSKTVTLSGTPGPENRGIINVKVTGVDAAGVEETTTLTIHIGGGPALTKPIPTQHLTPGKDFVYSLPKGMFIDATDGEKLNFWASTTDGSKLPAWLHFDAEHGRFYGRPPAHLTGVLEVLLTAMDSQHLSVTDSFDIILGDGSGLSQIAGNEPPFVASHLEPQSVKPGKALHFQVPRGSFVDSEDEELHLTAALADGKALPKWLHFDPASASFSGTPSEGDSGVIAVKVTARDSGDAAVNESFLINITGHAARASKLRGPMLPLRHFRAMPKAVVGHGFRFQVPKGTFGHADGSGPVSYEAHLSNGKPLPSWLHFDEKTGTFTGTPLSSETGSLSVEVVATDDKGSSASDSFVIDVRPTDLESIVLRDGLLKAGSGRSKWMMLMCISLMVFAGVVCCVAVGFFGFKVSIKRRFVQDSKLNHHQKKTAPVGTMRRMECCGAAYENYSTVPKDDIEILVD